MARRMPKALQFELRERLAQESARLMIEHGIVDYGLAKRKAAERLSVTTLGALPSNSQIEACLAERQRIFEPDGHGNRVQELRALSVRIMRQLLEFEPRLTGPALSGTATGASRIELHVFSASSEMVAARLEACGHRLAAWTQRFRYGGGRQVQIPGYRFQVDGRLISTSVFSENGIREAPLSAIDRRTMPRASLREVEVLLETESAANQLRSPIGT